MKSRARRLSVWLSIVFAGFLVVHTIVLLSQLGAFHNPYNFFDGHCQTIENIPGSEDIQLDGETGIVFVSSHDRRADAGGERVEGGIFMLDLNQTRPQPVELGKSFLPEFRPHGISLFKKKNQADRLFVINHRRDSSVVEIFTIAEDFFLKHTETVSGDLIVSPNNLTAIGSRKFYLTNDGRSRSRIHRALDTFLKRSSGNVVYFDGSGIATVVENLVFPNGIHAEIEDQKLYVAETIGGYLRIYRRDDNQTSVFQQEKIKIGRGMDNIHPGQGKHLWIGRHPNLLALNRHMRNAAKTSPSQVLKVQTQGNSVKVDTVYSSNGDQISGSASAVLYKDRLLIGVAFDSKMLLCECN